MSCLLFSVIIIFLSGYLNGLELYDGIINTRVQSATYLTNAITKILITIEIKNYGSDNTDKYILSLPKEIQSNLAFIEVYDSNKNRLQTDIETNIDGISNEIAENTEFYVVELPEMLKSDNGKSSQQLKLTIAYIHQLNPLPKQIKKTSKQFVTYQANKYFYSPYKTEKLGTKYSFASDKFKSYTKFSYYYLSLFIIYHPCTLTK